MLGFLAKRYAKTRYVFNQLVEGETNLLNAGLALRTAAEKHTLAAQLVEQADQMDARIKEVGEMEEKGYWVCENGHESSGCSCAHPMLRTKDDIFAPIVHIAGCRFGDDPVKCVECDKPMKPIKRDQMTGQEKYESDKERKDAEDMAKQKRDQAKAEEENAAQSEKTAAYFRSLAENNRRVAEKVRRI